MKPKKIERVERRRPRVEPNLVEDRKSRAAAAPKGVIAMVRRALRRR